MQDKNLFLHVSDSAENSMSCMIKADGLLMGCSTFGQVRQEERSYHEENQSQACVDGFNISRSSAGILAPCLLSRCIACEETRFVRTSCFVLLGGEIVQFDVM